MKKVTTILILTVLLIGCKKESITDIVTAPDRQPILNNPVANKNYKVSSYELSNPDMWFSSDQLYNTNGTRYTNNNPFIDQQSLQFDIDGDGYEDLFYFESYDLKINPTPNPPPAIFMNQNNQLIRKDYIGQTIKNPHATKINIGDFNNDNLPDVFSNVAVDPPNGTDLLFKDNNHLILNSKTGFNKVIEFPDLGFWYTGCSGDIDNDGDLDIVSFNFHNEANGVKNRIMWNDGAANFRIDINSVPNLSKVNGSELVDINHDSFLDLIISYGPPNASQTETLIFWGNGKTFSLSNYIKLPAFNKLISKDQPCWAENLDFCDIDKDGIYEVIVSGCIIIDGKTNYFISFYKSNDKGKTFVDKTAEYVDFYVLQKRFYHLIVKDIDRDGNLDLYSIERKDDIRWEWNGKQFIYRQ